MKSGFGEIMWLLCSRLHFLSDVNNIEFSAVFMCMCPFDDDVEFTHGVFVTSTVLGCL